MYLYECVNFILLGKGQEQCWRYGKLGYGRKKEGHDLTFGS